MSFCESCGKRLSDAANYCPHCGKKTFSEYLSSNKEESDSISFEVSAQDTDKPRVRPWARCFARGIDNAIFGVIYSLMITLVDPRLLINPWVLFIGGAFVFLILQALSFAMIGTTPGKSILNIKVLSDNHHINFGTAIKRELLVWLKGNWLLIPIIPQIVNYFALKKYGQTSWDRDLGLQVSHGTIGLGRVVAVIGILFLLSQTNNILGKVAENRLAKIYDDKAKESKVNQVSSGTLYESYSEKQSSAQNKSSNREANQGKIDPAQFSDLMNKGSVAMSRNDWSAAVTFYSQAMQYRPDFYPYYYRASSYMGLKDWEAARADFVRALDFKYKDLREVEIYYYLGIVCENLGRKQDAKSYYSEYLKISPDYYSPDSFYYRSREDTRRRLSQL